MPPAGSGKPSTRDVMSSMACYALFSSVMLIANKVAIGLVPLPACVLLVQIAVAPALILVLKSLRVIEVDDFSLPKLGRFAPYACSFVVSLYCNGKVLQYSNVETVITFRACSPLCVSFLDWLFLGRELPSGRSVLAMVGVIVGAVGYVLSDSEFYLRGVCAYGWAMTYLLTNVFEMTYGKMVLSRVELAAPVWGSVLYTKTLALAPMASLAVASGEARRLTHLEVGAWGALAVVFCSVAGVGISWSGWNCRDKVSATTYSLFGVACKLISVWINVMMWDKHATPCGLAWLLVCLLSSSFYQQAPLRAQSAREIDGAAAARKQLSPKALALLCSQDKLESHPVP